MSSRRAALVAVVALAAGVVATLLFVVGPFGASATPRPCSGYPAPSILAPAGTRVPADLVAKYAVLGRQQRPEDRLAPAQVTSRSVSGVIASGTRFLGNAGPGRRVYLVPAEHMSTVRVAPPRCLSPAQRAIERGSLPLLRREYRQIALCLVVVGGSNVLQDCAPATGSPNALLFTPGVPAFGLVPNGVSSVTVSYQVAPPTTVTVSHNLFTIVNSRVAPLPCGLAWLDPTGNVSKLVYGCSYLKPEERALSQYRSYVAGKLTALRSQVAELAGAISAGNVGQAKADWLDAHLTWLEIGQDDGAYGCFGALGGQIDGLAAGHPRGTADPAFTGFHRVEFDLWTKQDLGAAAGDTATLRKLLLTLTSSPLTKYLPATSTGIGNWLLRPHEILEDALRDSLTADDNYGSGTDLASITADASAVRVLLGELGPVLGRLAPGLAGQARGQLDALTRAVDATRRQGAWVSVQDLPARQRQQVDADVDAALETLAPLPELTTSTGKNAPLS